MSANVIRSLLAISRNAQSGVLEVEADGVCTMIYVLKGVPVFAEEGTLGETLGRTLLREGQITQAQYARIVEGMTGAVMGAEQIRFGEVAVELGFLTPEQVNAALAGQVQHKVERCLECELGHCAFRDAPDELEGIARYPIRVEPMVMRIMRTSFDEGRVSMMLEGAASSYPELVVPADRIAEQFEMDPAEAAFLAEIDGSRMVFQLIYQSPISSQRASQVLAVLLAAEAVLMHDEPLLQRMPSPKPEPMPEVRRPEPLLQPKPPPAPAPKPASPGAPRARMPSSPEVNATRRAMLRRLTRQITSTSYAGDDTLKSPASVHTPPPSAEADAPPDTPPSPPPPPAPAAAHPKDASVRAQQLFESGKRHAVNERWRLALPQLEQAARLCPSEAEYCLYAEWAKFQTLSEPGQMADLADRIKEMALKTLQKDKTVAFAHHVLGQIQMMKGDDKAALRSFRVATKLDPEDRVGARFHRMLARKRGERVD